MSKQKTHVSGTFCPLGTPVAYVLISMLITRLTKRLEQGVLLQGLQADQRPRRSGKDAHAPLSTRFQRLHRQVLD